MLDSGRGTSEGLLRGSALIKASVSIRDLLRENPTDKLDIKLNPDGSGQLYVPGLTESPVHSPEDINKVRASCCPFRVKALQMAEAVT